VGCQDEKNYPILTTRAKELWPSCTGKTYFTAQWQKHLLVGKDCCCILGILLPGLLFYLLSLCIKIKSPAGKKYKQVSQCQISALSSWLYFCFCSLLDLVNAIFNFFSFFFLFLFSFAVFRTGAVAHCISTNWCWCSEAVPTLSGFKILPQSASKQ